MAQLASQPLASRDNAGGEMRSASVKFASDGSSGSAPSRERGGKESASLSSALSSSTAMPSMFLAEELIQRGARKKPVLGQTIDTFHLSITHLHFGGLKLTGDIAQIVRCANLRVLYVYENRITSLRGLGGLRKLTHLYAQDNQIASLDDFEAPPALTQLHLGGNLLRVIGGLEQCEALAELHISYQKAPAREAAAVIDVADADEVDKGGDPDADGTAPRGPCAEAAMAIEPASMMAISPTLHTLTCASNRVDDDALEPFVMLQHVTSLDIRSNSIQSIGRLQQLLMRLPLLSDLKLGDNPLCTYTPKLRERVIVASPRIQTLDGKAVLPNERAFLLQLASRQGRHQKAQEGSSSAAGCAGAASSRASSATNSRGFQGGAAPPNRGRPQQLGVSIPSATSFDLGRNHMMSREIVGEPPAGFYEETHQPASLGLASGTRRPWARAPHAA